MPASEQQHDSSVHSYPGRGQWNKPSEQPQPCYISAFAHLRPILRVMLKVNLPFVVQDIVSFPNRPSLNDLANLAFRSSGAHSPQFT